MGEARAESEERYREDEGIETRFLGWGDGRFLPIVVSRHF